MTTTTTTAPCFSSVTSGPLPDPMVPEVLNPISLSSIFTLNLKNWISSETGTFTFLQWIGTSLQTTTNVKLSTNPLDTSFQFIFQKLGCSDQSSTINYGDRVQLVTYNILFANCGWGTCSTVTGSGDCLTGSWQTFIIRSANGSKTGPVCFGDDIYITQTTGTNCSVSAAGANGVFCVDGDTSNAVITIFPVGGSLYVDPTDYVNQYAKNQENELCKQNPYDLSCISRSISNFFSSIWLGFLIVAGLIGLILIFMLIYYARQSLSGISLFSSSSTVNTVATPVASPTTAVAVSK